MKEWELLEWMAHSNYSVMQWTNEWWWWSWIYIFFIGSLIQMTPLKLHHEQSFTQIIGVWIRRLIIIYSTLLIALPFVLLYVYEISMDKSLGDSSADFIRWFEDLLLDKYWYPIPAILSGMSIRIIFNRYVIMHVSGILRKLRKRQMDDEASDIKDERNKYRAKEFNPKKYYKEDKILVGLSESNKPVHVPVDVFRETNMQVIGPTRYGKGVVLGCLMDQIIKNGDTLFYIDPKDDTFAAHVMYQACLESKRQFYYVSMDDLELGSWGPFMGGNDTDALSRLEIALGLELTGDPATDFYKTQEMTDIRNAFDKTRRIESLYNEIINTEAKKSEAELSAWKNVKSLCPKSHKGFSIEKAIKENAVVYFKGSLDDRVIKTATKMFIIELVQESRRLFKSGGKTDHLTCIVDEVSFLVSKQLKEALATVVGFGVNFVCAYQSPEDLVNTDDINLNGRALKHSMDVNSQIKAVYGGADFETAEWAANLSGTTTKEVTKLERTEIVSGGAETWENNRTIGAIEENLVHVNVVLSLPKKVCVFIQPGELLKPLFTAFVPVKNMELLNDFLNNKKITTQKSGEKNESKPKQLVSKETENFQEISNKGGENINKLKKNKDRRDKQKLKKKGDSKSLEGFLESTKSDEDALKYLNFDD